jgi:hypothetical protein
MRPRTPHILPTCEPGDTTWQLGCLSELSALLNESQSLMLDLHLQIESYYVFAKIVLDDVARAIDYYFGAGRGLSLDSHDDWARKAQAFAAEKGLRLREELIVTITDLKKRVCDFRDQQIAHEKCPRTMQATGWAGDSKRISVATW